MDIIETVAKLRIAVAHLGELKGWWPTEYYSEAASGFMDYAFPRNKQAAYIASCDTVRSILDKKIGSHNFHLFRLTVVLEEKIHRYLSNLDFVITEESKELELLENVAKSLQSDKNAGPKNIGSMEGLDDDTLQVFASEYLDAFNNKYEVHPYLI